MPQAGLLAGCCAIVTGGNRGLGLEIARHYAAAGANLALGARDETLLRREIDTLRSMHPKATIRGRHLDVMQSQDVSCFVNWAISELGHVDALVNNAGVYGPMGAIEDVAWDAWVDAFAINVYGSVLMVRAVVPHMKKRRRGAIVQISGGGATNPLPGISAYAAAKAAIVRFAETLALEVKEYGITVNAIAPGALNTRMLDEVLQAGPEKVGQDLYDQAMKQRESGGTPLGKGAELAVFLATDAARGITGRLISAVWDRWDEWPNHIDALEGSDLYTLRRITGRDRGQSWGDR